MRDFPTLVNWATGGDRKRCVTLRDDTPYRNSLLTPTLRGKDVVAYTPRNIME